MSLDAQNPSAEELLSHATWIQSLARSLTSDPAEADEFVQQTWIAAWQHGEVQRGSLKAWLAAILRNVARQERRSEGARRGRERKVARPEALPSDDELLARLEQQRVLVDLVRHLSESQRSVVILRFYEGLDTNEIARRLGEKPDAIRQRLKRALDRLRRDLDGNFGGREAWLSAFTPLTQWTPAATKGAGALIGSALVMKKVIAIAATCVLFVGGIAIWNRGVAPEAEDAELATTGMEQGAALEPDGTPVNSASASPLAASSDSKEGESSRVAAAPVDSTWTLRGQVNWPKGYDGQEDRLEVFALSERFNYGSFIEDVLENDDGNYLLGRASVDEAGEFALELDETLRSAHLMLRGRFLYVEQTQECPNVRSAEPAQIDALAGTWIEGRLLPPLSDPSADLSDIQVRLSSRLSFEDDMGSNMFRFRTASDEEGVFEFMAVPPVEDAQLSVRPERFAASNQDQEDLRPLEHRELKLRLQVGGVLEGVVLDEKGVPIPAAEVRALWRGEMFGFDDDTLREAETNEEGEFSLPALPPGDVHLVATGVGFLDSQKVAKTVIDQQTHGGIQIELSKGRALSGVVRFEDGRPAVEAELLVTFDQNFGFGPAAFNQLRGAKGSARSDAEGSFRVSGLGGGPFVLIAKSKQDGVDYLGRLDAVASDTQDIDLVLHPPLSIHGLVQDAVGKSVESFTVHASRMSEGTVGEMESGSHREDFESPDGRFEISGLQPGKWNVVVTAETSAPSAKETVMLPRDGVPLSFVLELPASVSGTVVTSDGIGVANAQVEIDTGLSVMQNRFRGGPERPRDDSDDLGFFQLTGLRPGPVQIHATAEGYTWSESANLELKPGEELASVKLVLRKGGRITGEAYDDGKPAAGRMVNLIQWGAEAFDTRMTETDAEGRFALENVLAGSWQLLVIDNSDDWGAGEGDSAVHNMFDSMMTARVEVSEGSEEHLILGAAPKEPVRVHGRVLRGGQGFNDVALSFQNVTEGVSSAEKLVSVDKDGRFETVVDGAGTYFITATRMASVAGNISAQSFRRDIPSEAEHRLDIELPGGGISGRVLDEAGEALAQVRIVLLPSAGAELEQLFSPRYIETSTESDGSFEMGELSAGEYMLLAGGGLVEDGAARHARVVTDGLVVDEDRWLRGVEIRLPEPGSLSVVATDYLRTPVAGAVVFVRNEAGQVLEALSMESTDSEGRLSVGGLAPGNYRVFARNSSLASAEVAVVVKSGESSGVEVELEPGSWLTVRTLDRSGEPVGSVATLLDDGLEVGQVFIDMNHAIERMHSMITGEHRIGPLRAGSYRLQVVTPSGARAKKPVRIKDGEDRRVTVRPK